MFVVAVVSAFFVTAFYIKFRYRGRFHERREAFIKNAQYYCGWMVKVFNVDITIKGAPVAGTNFLYVGNHMGFVDIFVLASKIPAMFITSQEMRETPLLGSLCEMGGCVFVERRSRTQIVNELGTLKQALEQGFNVVLYPEATSTNGEAVLPFKKTLMMAGPQSNRPIQPGCINFTEINGEDFNLDNRDAVCWYGDMTFVEAIWGSLTTSSIKVQLEFLEPMYEAPDADRGHVAIKAHSLISAHFKPARRSIVEVDQTVAAAD